MNSLSLNLIKPDKDNIKYALFNPFLLLSIFLKFNLYLSICVCPFLFVVKYIFIKFMAFFSVLLPIQLNYSMEFSSFFFPFA